jgi:S1-C subfamily serine protease
MLTMSFTYLDYALIVFALISVYNGWRRGLILGIFSVAGLLLGIWIANSSLDVIYGASNEVNAKRITITSIIFLVGIFLGSAVGAIIGAFTQRLIARGPIKLLNKITGSGFAIVTWALVVWLISGFLSGLPVSRITAEINDSTVIAKLDELAPNELRDYAEAARSFVITSQLPEVAINAIVGPDVSEPDAAILANENIAEAIKSVARIESISEECNTKLSGSGFVISDNLVVTNAHVVAGITKPNVRIGGKGKAVSGKVIYFNPDVDLALIRTTKLTAPALTFGEDLQRNDMAVVAGFPGGGSLSMVPARVKAVASSVDSNIYGLGQFSRELYVLRADVKQGDSGAALINDLGQLTGVIFAASATEVSIGYALTNAELRRALESGENVTESADTGECIPIE